MGKKLLVPDEFLLRYSILRLIAAHRKNIEYSRGQKEKMREKI